ncbi:hypothetical protein D3C80_1628040 [compost metagenome]
MVVLVSRRVSSTSQASSGLGSSPAWRRSPSAMPISRPAAASSGFWAKAAVSAWGRLSTWLAWAPVALASSRQSKAILRGMGTKQSSGRSIGEGL